METNRHRYRIPSMMFKPRNPDATGLFPALENQAPPGCPIPPAASMKPGLAPDVPGQNPPCAGRAPGRGCAGLNRMAAIAAHGLISPIDMPWAGRTGPRLVAGANAGSGTGSDPVRLDTGRDAQHHLHTERRRGLRRRGVLLRNPRQDAEHQPAGRGGTAIDQRTLHRRGLHAGARAAGVVTQMGFLCLRLGRMIQWDSKPQKFSNAPDANRLIPPPSCHPSWI